MSQEVRRKPRGEKVGQTLKGSGYRFQQSRREGWVQTRGSSWSPSAGNPEEIQKTSGLEGQDRLWPGESTVDQS